MIILNKKFFFLNDQYENTSIILLNLLIYKYTANALYISNM